MRRLLIVGAGGFGREVLAWATDCEATHGWEIGGFLDANPEALASYSLDSEVLGHPETYTPQIGDVFLCSIGDPKTRMAVTRSLEERGARFATLVHPTAIVGPRCELGEGSILCPGVVLTCDVIVGRHTILNVYATAGHDVVMGDYCTLSGHVDCTGHVTLGTGAMLGTHASAIPGVRVGDYAAIGAGSCAYRNVRDNSTIVGIPGRRIANIAGAQRRGETE